MRVSTIAWVCLLCACSPKRAPRVDDSLPREECLGRSDGVLCFDDQALTCRAEAVVAQENCTESGKVCAAERGCLTCLPGTHHCDGQRYLRCNDEGDDYEEQAVCEEGLSCSISGCLDLCFEALQKRSYIGCEYYPVFTRNAQLDDRFQPAVVIANPNLVPAQVSITGAQGIASEVEVAPESVETVMLSFLPALKAPNGSVLVKDGAYRLLSSVPVTVHQFNPLLFEVAEDCVGPETGGARIKGDNKCNSFSNDASLLLPAHVLSRPEGLGTAYLVMSRPSLMTAGRPEGPYEMSSPGFVAIVGVAEEPVEVHISSSAHTLAAELGGKAGSDAPVRALEPGATLTMTLARGDVLQLLSAAPAVCPESGAKTNRSLPDEYSCPLGPDYDLTGTLIEADGAIEVIAGHNCAYVPFDRVACDHLEETMFPLETWGVEAIAPRPRAGRASPHIVRVMSAADGNEVRFEPDSVHAPITLGRAQSFELMTSEHVIVRADKPIAVAQYLVGQGEESRVGDPSLSMAIPTEQYRSAYAFLSPSSYDVSYVSVIARAGDEVRLDGTTLGGFMPIGDGAFEVTAVPLTRAGPHEVHSEHNQGIGVNVYGYGDYTSYMLPGGLDLRVIGTVY
jgi:IgGFc binding protein